MKRRLLSALVVFGLLGAAGATAADPAMPGMPPNIQKIMEKMQSGQQPTPAEQKALTEWGETMAGVKPGSSEAQMLDKGMAAAPADSRFTVGSGEDQSPCHKAGKAAAFGQTPSRDAYIAMAEDAMRAYRGRLAQADQTRLNDVLTRSSNPSFGAELATLLVAHGDGSMAVVSAAYAAQKAPDDPVTANNLGALLRGMHDYTRAAMALQYAKSKAPDSPVIASNLGWLAISQGDSGTAGKLFSAARSKNGQMSAALLGQGLIQLCTGHPAQALPLFRASIKSGFSDLAEAGINSAESDIANSKNPGADNGGPDSYGSSAGGDMPDWQDPPFPKEASVMAQSHDVILKYLDYWADHAKHAASEAQAVGLQVQGASTTGTNGKLVFTRGNEKESFVLGDIRNILGRTTGPLIDKWAKDVMDRAIPQDGCHGCAGDNRPEPSCSWRVTVVPIHKSLVPGEAATWTALRKSFADLYGFSRPWIQQIHDPARARVETAALESWVTSNAVPFAQPIENWQGEVAIDFAAGTNCNPPPDLRGTKGKLKPYKIDPTKCKSGSMSMNFGIANLNADCDHMTLTMGEGLVGAAEWKFAPDYTTDANGVMHPAKPDWSNDQISIFAGAGTSGSGPLTGNAAAGGYVTIQNGNLIDAGGQAQAGITIGNGEETPVTYQAGATARVSLISGPDVTTSSGFRVGGNCGVSC